MAINKDGIRLTNLGFSTNESLVYETLMKEGASPAGMIIAKTNLHRNIVYTALDHLIDKKLVSMKNARNKMIFETITPDILITEYQEKQKLAEQLLLQYENTITNKEVREISIHEGNDEYLRLLTSLIDSMPRGSTKYVLGTGGEEFMENTMRSIWDKYHAVAKNRKIHIKMLGYTSQKNSVEPDIRGLKMYETRYMDSRNPNPAGIHIYPEIDTVLNIIYSTKYSPVTAIRIKNKALTEGYLNLFRSLWSVTKD